ncbi:MAG TPA: phosphoribosyltransferase [Gemmatimonadales bacterium]|nr:phosphoribosyltransferase [Gemmatimonadales bacterium]
MNPELEDMLAAGPVFRDRTDAGRVLAAELERYRGTDALVLGLPRGGVVVAAEVARQLDAELDVIVARKLGSPLSPELAIGAVTAEGGVFLNRRLIYELGISEPYVSAVIHTERSAAERREALFRGARPRPRIAGRTVILVDDGLATGATMHAAVRSVRREAPARLIVAVPVGSPEACAALRGDSDEVVCPYQPEEFGAVGLWYRRFGQTDDTEVKELLDELGAAARSAP